MKNKYLNI